MEYTGLTGKYPVDRTLTEQEREGQLGQKERLEIEPAYQLSLIKLNSTYLELVDKYFPWKGLMTLFAIGAFLIVGGASAYGAYVVALDAIRWDDPEGHPPWTYAIVLLLLLLVCVWAFVKILRKESFAYTHYPIRFNRKMRTVHVFRVNGTVLSVPWDSVFFCLGSLRQGNWELQGHVLADDGVTITETFCAFPQVAGNEVEREQLKAHWELIRRYMEDGPEDAFQRAKICLPIADCREKVSFGFHRMHAEGTGNLITQLWAAVLGIAIMPGRWFAMQTSKIPQWPAEIEVINQIEPDDPFVRDASMNEKWKELPDILWLAISALFWAVVIYWASGLEPWH